MTEYTNEVTEEHKEKAARKVFSLGDIRLYECPLSFITRDTHEIMSLVFLIENSGHLLHAGGWGNQPAWLVEAYQIYKAEAAKNAPKEGKNGDEN